MTLPFGVRIVIKLIVRAATLYMAHEGNCASALPGPVCDAMQTIIGALDDLKALNPPGPR